MGKLRSFLIFKAQKGSALPMVLILLVIFMILGVTLLDVVRSNFTIGIFSHQTTSAYYIAEAGVRYGMQSAKNLALMYKSATTATAFFSSLESSPPFVSGMVITNFTEQYGSGPKSEITFQKLSEESVFARVYRITALGIVNSAKSQLSADIRITFPDSGALDEFLDNVFVSAGQVNFRNTGQVTGSTGLLWVRSSVANSDFNGGSFNQLCQIYIDGDLEVGQGIDLGSPATPDWLVVTGSATIDGNARILSPFYVYDNLTIPSGSARFNKPVYVNGDLITGKNGTAPNPSIDDFIKYHDLYLPSGTRVPKVIYTDTPSSVAFKGFNFNLRNSQWYQANSYITSTAQLLPASGGTYRLSKNTNYAFDLPNITFSKHWQDGEDGNISGFSIVSSGNVTLDFYDKQLIGVIIAKGDITVNAKRFDGVILCDGKITFNGNTDVNMKPIKTFFPSNDHIPVTFSSVDGNTSTEPSVDLITLIK